MHKDLWYVIPVTMIVAVGWYGWAVEPTYREALTGLIRLALTGLIWIVLPAALIVWIIEGGGDSE